MLGKVGVAVVVDGEHCVNLTLAVKVTLELFNLGITTVELFP